MNYNNVIVVKNTKELEMMDLSRIPDNAEIRVVGGLYGKQKYATKDHYRARTTYPLGQLKQIMSTMREIESNINPNWSELAKARYIYEVLGNNIGYDLNRANYSNQQASNLSILLSREGICAGYSLLFKEMMDRQGIECDYVRGDAFNSRGGKEKHAWNVLKINGKNIPIDLTWDAPNIKNGKGLHQFGNNYQFTNNHFLDYDEVQYQYDYLSPAELANSDFRNYKPQQAPNRDIKKETYSNALRETYVKYSRLEDPNKALNRIQNAMYSYITTGNSHGFTRDGFARENLEKNVSKEEFLDYLVNDYVQKFTNKTDPITVRQSLREQHLANAITETMMAYSPEQAKAAIKEFIATGKTNMFTNQGNSKARTTLAHNVSNVEVLNFLINNTIKHELFKQHNIDIHASIRAEQIGQAFSGQEFELVSAPQDKNIFRKAIDWIKSKTKTLTKSHDNSAQNGQSLKTNKNNNSYER
ncbi:MAG: hypothetical protein K1W33_02565 [Clostridia bacterium]